MAIKFDIYPTIEGKETSNLTNVIIFVISVIFGIICSIVLAKGYNVMMIRGDVATLYILLWIATLGTAFDIKYEKGDVNGYLTILLPIYILITVSIFVYIYYKQYKPRKIRAKGEF